MAVQPDGSGNANDATVNGATWLMDDERASGVMDFDGSNDFLEALDSESLSLSSDLSLATWVRVPMVRSSPQRQRMITKQARPYALNLVAGRPEFQLGNASGGFGSVTANSGARVQQWEHFAATFKGNVATIYRNGEQVASDTINVIPGDGGSNLFIGGQPTGVAFFLLGRLDDVAVFSGALSADDVQKVMAGEFEDFIKPPDVEVDPFPITVSALDPGALALTIQWIVTPGANYVVEFSTDLVTWEVSDAVVQIGDATATARVPMSGRQGFVRVKSN